MKATVISIIAAAVIIGGAVMFTGRSAGTSTSQAQAHNVSVVDGKQIIAISVKGGYSPQVSTAKADMPSTLRLETNGTFDCSSSLTIQALGYREHLPQSGVTEVQVPPQKAGTTIRGVCAMGMYNFAVNFK